MNDVTPASTSTERAIAISQARHAARAARARWIEDGRPEDLDARIRAAGTDDVFENWRSRPSYQQRAGAHWDAYWRTWSGLAPLSDGYATVDLADDGTETTAHAEILTLDTTPV